MNKGINAIQVRGQKPYSDVAEALLRSAKDSGCGKRGGWIS